MTEITYISPFSNWDENASVRSRPGRTLEGEPYDGIYYYSPDLVPILEHPLIKEHGEEIKHKILIYQLFAHLSFTETLEHEIVNQVAYRLGTRKYDFVLPTQFIEDAWKLYVDEAYHFMFSADLANQIERVTKVGIPNFGPPRFLRKINAIIGGLPKVQKELIQLFFSIVSETLITGTLLVIPRDKSVIAPVREVISDHAEDEGRHQAYFSSILYYIWGQLTPKQKKEIGVLLPEFLFGFVEPDYEVTKKILSMFSFSNRQISNILEGTYAKEKVIEDTRRVAKSTLYHLLHSGVFEDQHTLETFLNYRLIDENFLSNRK